MRNVRQTITDPMVDVVGCMDYWCIHQQHMHPQRWPIMNGNTAMFSRLREWS
jgi:hypothetical protein